jgi:hypothetical protein
VRYILHGPGLAACRIGPVSSNVRPHKRKLVARPFPPNLMPIKLFPQSRLGRRILSVWLFLCVALLIFAVVQRKVHDMPMAFTYLLIALTFPLGIPFGAIVGVSMSWLYANFGLTYHPVADLVPSWIVMVLAGYIQWFVLGPAAVRKLLGKRA